MLYTKTFYGGVHYNTLDRAVSVYVKDVSGQVIVDKN